MSPELARPQRRRSEGRFGFFLPKPERRESFGPGSHERIIVVSDLHGAKPEVLARLNAIPRSGEQKPAAVILGGDVVGNPDLEELQKLFYNGVINHARAALSANPSIAATELVNYVGASAPEGATLKEGFRALRHKEMELEGLSAGGLTGEKAQRRDVLLQKMDDDESVASEIRRYTTEYVHYGHYASNLHPDAVKKLADGLRVNAAKLAEPLKKLQESGVQVVINEGNWDPSPPIAFRRGTSDAQRLTAAEQQGSTGFSTQKFFEEQGIRYVTGMEVLETETTAMVLLPFDQLVKYADMDLDTIRENEKEKLANIQRARREGRQVIVVQHGEVMWEPHNLTDPNSQPKGEHARIIAGSGKINKILEPDEIVYGHFHGPFVNASGEEQAMNTKYAVVFDAGSPVVIAPQDHAAGQSVVSYMPLQRFATILVPREKEDNKRRIHGFGGQRQPAVVS
jgi:predicted phosphodiesterase